MFRIYLYVQILQKEVFIISMEFIYRKNISYNNNILYS